MVRAKAESRADTAPSLVYVTGDQPGISRHRRGSGFAYRRPDGRWLRPSAPADGPDIERIRRLAVPPAYTDVWICPLTNGHLQATGRDGRGRKQYRYHAQWMHQRDSQKFQRLMAFGAALPRLRQAIDRDLARQSEGSDERTRVLAALVRLLDATRIRVGNESYARSNQSFGLTTLRMRHVSVSGTRIRLRFRGKSGVMHHLQIDDPQVARIVRRCQALPGQELFQYEDEQGQVRGIDSNEVNAYIRAAMKGDFSAKDFRTWHASVHAWSLLCPPVPASSEAADQDASEAGVPKWSQRRLRDALQEVAAGLGNTVAVCRKSYVHPALLECAAQGCWPALSRQAPRMRRLDRSERGLMAFLSAWHDRVKGIAPGRKAETGTPR